MTPELTLETLARRVEAIERQLGFPVASTVDPPGTTGDEQSDDPAAVVRWVAAFDAIPPAVMTADEEAAWQAARTAQRQIDTAAVDRLAGSPPRAAG